VTAYALKDQNKELKSSLEHGQNYIETLRKRLADVEKEAEIQVRIFSIIL